MASSDKADKLDSESADAKAPDSVRAPVDPITPNALPVLAELELATRKLAFLEQRIVACERDLFAAAAEVSRLAEVIAPAPVTFDDELAALVRRIERQEKRREAQLNAESDTRRSERLLHQRNPVVPDARAIVRARWTLPEARRGDRIGLLAQCDGVDPTTPLVFEIRSLVHAEPLAALEAQRKGDAIVAQWEIPKGIAVSELVFEVAYGGQQARSPVLVLPDD